MNGGDGAEVFSTTANGTRVRFDRVQPAPFAIDIGTTENLVVDMNGGDTLLFNRSNASEVFDASANGERVRFTRDVGNIVMDLGEVERIHLNALGGADAVLVNDFIYNELTAVDIDLAGTIGGSAGDGQADTVVVNADDFIGSIDVFLSGTLIVVDGLPARVTINAEAALDTLVIDGNAGADQIDASALPTRSA